MVLQTCPAMGSGACERRGLDREAAHAAQLHNALLRAKDYCDFTTLATASAGWYDISAVWYSWCLRVNSAFVIRTCVAKILEKNHRFDIGYRLPKTTSTEGQPS